MKRINKPIMKPKQMEEDEEDEEIEELEEEEESGEKDEEDYEESLDDNEDIVEKRQKISPVKQNFTKKEIPEKLTAEQDKEIDNDIYVAFHQPEIIGIMDTRTNQIVIQGYSEEAMAVGQAKLLNLLEKIGIASGAE